MTSYTLHLMQASSAHTLSDVHALDDILFDLGRNADAVTFTEVQDRHDQLRQACQLRGYQLVLPLHGDVAVAVRSIHRVTDHGELPVLAAVGHDRDTPAHTARPILWVRFVLFGTRERVTVSTAHWVTKRADVGHQQQLLSTAMAAAVRASASGSRLGFWTGDTNDNDGPRTVSPSARALAKGELTSCWDELGRYPDSHGNALLDIIGSYDPDRRVSCIRARVWARSARVRLHSDHRPVSAWYRISPVKGSTAH